MKTELQVTGRVELTHDDVSKAIIQYLKNNFDYKVGRIIYPDDQSKVRIIAEVTGKLHNDKVEKFEVKDKQVRQTTATRKWENVGIFDTIRSLLNEAFIKSKGPVATVPYDKLLVDVLFFHPLMNDKKLRVYLKDKRQLGTNVEWNPKTSPHIVVRSIINH